jgi:hypothetical protein
LFGLATAFVLAATAARAGLISGSLHLRRLGPDQSLFSLLTEYVKTGRKIFWLNQSLLSGWVI